MLCPDRSRKAGRGQCGGSDLGNNQKKQIVEALEEYEKEHTKKVKVIEINKTKEYEDLSIGYTAEHVRWPISRFRTDATSSVLTASSLMRGRVRSRKIAEVLDEVRALAARGYKEVVLTGIHLSSYGVDFKGGRKGESSVTDPGSA